VDEWKDKANQPDNHLLDCVAGAAVAGGVMGCQLSRDITGDVRVAAPKKKRNFNL
jgi:hypothetical protein